MKKILYIIGIFTLLLIIFKPFFLPGLLTAGDFWPYSNTLYENFSIQQYAWNSIQGNGFGDNVIPLLWIFMNLGITITIFGKMLGLSWEVIERIAYLYPFLILTTISPVLLFRRLFPKNNLYILSSAIYLLNPYILMVIAGGQILGIGMAYAIFPLVLYFFINLTKNITIRNSIIFGFIFAFQLLFDIRIFYIGLISLFIISLFMLRAPIKKTGIYILLIPFIIIFLLHAFWLFPLIARPFNPISAMGEEYSTTGAVKFFSFATLENTISLLHPNYPENIFGKVGFMKPEFLLLPILAFSSLLFIRKKEKKERLIILALSLIGLTGAFLAKGTQDPLGNFYLFLFEYFPGMQMFRDPTKFYILVAISFSMLIPYGAEQIYIYLENFKKNKIKVFKYLFPFGLLILLFILIRHAFIGQLPGIFKPVKVPPEYIKLEKMLSKDETFYRTLWVPTVQRFSYYSPNHPSVSFFNLYNTHDYEVIKSILNDPKTEEFLKEKSIKYIIVPTDPLQEIYLDDRKYSEKLYKKIIDDVSETFYLKRNTSFKQIGVFEIEKPRGHFWNLQTQENISSRFINSSTYILSLNNVEKNQRIIFVENYNQGWVMKIGSQEIYSQNHDGINSFTIPESGTFNATITFKPQKLVNYGSIISIVSLITILVLLIKIKK